MATRWNPFRPKRHPENREFNARSAQQIAVKLQQALISRVPELQSILDKGWHPEFDIKSDINPDNKPERITYKDLAPDVQEEVFASSLAFQYACTALAKVSGYPPERWLKAITEQVNEQIDAMPKEAVLQSIEDLDKFREQAR